MAAVLLVDDDETGRTVAAYNLRRAGLEVDEASSAREALAAFDPHRHAVVVTDWRMPGGGKAVVEGVSGRDSRTPVVVITAYGSVEVAVEAMRAGAWDFLEKPFGRERLEVTVRRALETRQLRDDVEALKAGRVERPILAVSAAMKQVLDLVDRYALSDAAVLVSGESGTGKELVARRLHARSGRSGGPFVAINCAAVPAELMEAELFGHTRGAFTGAVREREGRFRAAHGGTLLLDEVAELPLAVQAKLLRVLQEGAVDVLGSDRPVSVDVRVVASTHRDLRQLVRDGQFREDLFFRLVVLEIPVPPLRARPDDIGPLARRFVAELSERALEVPDEVVAALAARPWPGNVRELRNACERLVWLAPGNAVRVEDLPPEQPSASGSWLDQIPEGLSLVDLEAEVIAHTLARTGWNVSEAARRLGVPRHILTYRIQKHGLKR